MSKPRYAIVRVENKCPKMFIRRCLTTNIQCKDCYGDTKEQLIKKVAQVISRYRNNLEVCEYCDMAGEFEIAKEIVEFLGVE